MKNDHTTNSIESYNSQLRKVLKGKGAFPNEISVMKLIYLTNHKSHEEMATSTFKLESNIKSIINLISRSFKHPLYNFKKLVYTLNLTRSENLKKNSIPYLFIIGY